MENIIGINLKPEDTPVRESLIISILMFGDHPLLFRMESSFVTFIDHFSRKVWIYMLKRKADVFIVFKQFRALVEKSTGRSIKFLRTDNGGEFTSMKFEKYCKEFGIDRYKTTAYTPQQNRVVECMIMTLLGRVRSMLSNANLQQEMWAKEISTSCYLVNQSPSTTIECKILKEVWIGHPCNYFNLKVFGCEAYALILKHQRSKLDLK
jgi:hypothetical protein